MRKAKIVQLWEERRRSGECTYKQIVVNSSLIDHRNVFLHEKYESIVLAWKKGDFAWCLRLAPQRLSLMQFPLCPSFHEQSSKLHLSNSKQTPKHKNCWAHYTFYISYLTQQKNWPYKMTCEKERRKKENDPNDTKVPNLRVWQIQKFQFSRQKSIVVLWPFFGTKIELQNFKLIGKSVNWFIFSLKIQNYSFEFLRQKWPKYHCWFLALKLKHLKWVCLTFNERILRFCQNKTSHESAILQFCAKKSFSATASTGGDYVQKCSQKLHKEYYKW